MEENLNTIVILTALEIEQQAILNKLSSKDNFTHPLSKTVYVVGHYLSNGNNLKIVVGRTNQTNTNAGIETERIIQQFKPNYIFFVGVAGGLKDVKIGDVVIGADVFGYEKGKFKEEFLPRPQFAFSSYELEQQAVNFSSSDEWKLHALRIVNQDFHDKISVYSGTIASGEKVLASEKSDIYKFLKIQCSHAFAVEMEGLGFLEACRPYPLIKTLLVRTISDLIEGKTASDNSGSQEYATKIGAEFIFGLIDYIEIKQTISTSELQKDILEIVTKLYPMGLQDNEIWQRAGGDLSLVQIQTNGKAQWVNALRLIKNGGGGNISFNSLIREMKSDYPKNESLKTY